MPLDPEVRRYLEAQPVSPTASVAERRELRRRQGITAIEDREIPGPHGPIPVRIYTPPGPRPLPILVYYHGGGWVTGDLETHDFQCRLMCRWAGCLLVHVNYRHAPEHPFPAAVDDAYAGACWVADNAAALGGDPSCIAIGGDSAGGNLTAVVTLLARDRGGPRFCFQYLGYPVTDAALDTPSAKENATGYGLSHETMLWYWDQYVHDPAMRFDPLVSPLRAKDLSGLPPALVLTAEFDPLRDEGEAYARRLIDAGVPTVLKRYDGMVHGFLGQTPEVAAARGALGDLTDALKAAFAHNPTATK